MINYHNCVILGGVVKGFWKCVLNTCYKLSVEVRNNTAIIRGRQNVLTDQLESLTISLHCSNHMRETLVSKLHKSFKIYCFRESDMKRNNILCRVNKSEIRYLVQFGSQARLFEWRKNVWTNRTLRKQSQEETHHSPLFGRFENVALSLHDCAFIILCCNILANLCTKF